MKEFFFLTYQNDIVTFQPIDNEILVPFSLSNSQSFIQLGF